MKKNFFFFFFIGIKKISKGVRMLEVTLHTYKRSKARKDK
jgi:hypothetical protein